jgi:hypothetical protein
MRNLEPRLVIAAVGLVFVALGLPAAVNFRNAAASHARRNIESVRRLERPLRRVPLLRRLRQPPMDEQIAHQVPLMRLTGGIFVGLGLLLLIDAVISH